MIAKKTRKTGGKVKSLKTKTLSSKKARGVRGGLATKTGKGLP